METCLDVCADGSKKYLDESGVRIGVHGGHTTPEKSKPFFNPKMKTCRELVLATLGVLVEERTETVTCLDAFGASGVAALQWKKRYTDACHVTITEKEATCVTSIMDNCLSNRLVPCPCVLNFTRVPGLPLQPQQRNEVFVKQCDVNVMMHMEAYDFIHLDPFGCPVKFLVSAFTNVRNNGVICLVATDVGSLFAKNSNVARRNYGASVVKTEYVQELGARILIASAARAAAVCCKGVQVLCAVNREHFVLVCVRVRRGAAAADCSLQQVREAIHCQICGERALHPATNNPIEHPYGLLSCCCHADNPGKTAVTIGPMWCGDLYNTDFVLSMYKQAVKQGLSKRVTVLLAALVLESACPNSTTEHSTLTSAVDQILCRHVSEECLLDKESEGTKCSKGVSEIGGTGETKRGEKTEDSKTQLAKQGLLSKHCTSNTNIADDVNNSAESHNIASTELNSGGDVSKGCDKEDGPHPAKCPRLAEVSQDQTGSGGSQNVPWPIFYYDLHRQKLPGNSLPKTAAVVSLLQRAGFRASKTHFNSTAVRTSANLSQICQVLSQDSILT